MNDDSNEFKMVVLISKNGRDYYNISFPYDATIVANVKSLEKREYDTVSKCWKLDAYNLFQLINLYKGKKNIFFDFVDEGEKEKFISKFQKAVAKRELDKAADLVYYEKKKEYITLKESFEDKTTEELLEYSKYLNEGIIPYKHQVVGALLGKFANRQLIAADLGTGKSLLSILCVELQETNIKKVLVIVPNSLKYNWAIEVEKFTKQKAYILNEKKKTNNKNNIEECKYFIVNYEYFRASNFDFENKIMKFGIDNPDFLIFDESHKLKNTKSNTTKNIKKFFKKLDDVPLLLLSGTPMPSRVEELFVQLNFIAPKEFPSKNKFYTEYCGLRYDPYNYGWVPNGNETLNLDPIIDKMQTLMYRVKKKDVLKNLPEIQINKIYLELNEDQEKTYSEIEEGFRNINWSAESFITTKKEEGTTKEMGFLEIVTKLRQFTSIVKLDLVKQFVTDLNDANEKVVIFDAYINPLKQLTEMFKHNSKIYYGDIEPFVRQEYVNEFQDEKSNLKNLFVSTPSGNFGITLTTACNMLILNQDFVPGINEQMYARLHRIGQLRPVSIYVFVIKDTVDEYIDNLLKDKMKVISKVIDKEEFVDSSSPSILGDLFSKLKRKYSK